MGLLGNAWLRIPASRRKQLFLLILAVIVLLIILWAARGVLAPYIIALIFAYLLVPVVDLLEKGLAWVGSHRYLGFFKKSARPLAIIITYLVVIALVVGFFSSFVPLIIEQSKELWGERDAVWEYLYGFGSEVIEQYQLLPAQVQTQIEDALGRLGTAVADIVQQAVGGTAVAISYTVSLVLAILIIPFWDFYLLLDTELLTRGLVRVIPVSIREDVLKIIYLIDTILGSYLRGQLLLGLIIGVVSTISFMVLGVNFALLLGLIAGLFEMIPNIGPTLGAIPAILVALTQDPTKALWVLIYAIMVQQLENMFISPRVLGRSVQLHPVVIMVVLVIGSEISGVPGLFIAPVVTAVLRDLFRYLYYRMEAVPLSPDEALRKVLQGGEFEMCL